MLNFFCLNIAGFNIGIESNGSLPITLQSDPAYKNFIFFNRKPSYDIFIKLTDDLLPDISNLKILFDNNESWSLLTDGNFYYIKFQPPVFDKPYLTAKINKDFTDILIFCSDFLIENQNGIKSIFNPVHYPIDQIILMHYLALRKGVIFHAAGGIINKKCFLFMGRSGAGKSTISRLCLKDKRFSFLSDDRIIVGKVLEKIQASGTPWPGDEGIAINEHYPLSGIFFIYHATENRVDKISPLKAFEKLLPVTSIPWYEEESISKIFSFCEELTSTIPAYDLFFKADENIADFLYNFISGITQ